ncbi:MAG: zinc ribbon domain-containing protein [Candidatus Lokiarchaeota archaeon]|nr:zinc ribbon domain-containing protein [Candidatus Lokiarchaeota archaeon]
MVLHSQKLPKFVQEEKKSIQDMGPKRELKVLFDETREPGKWINEARSRFLLILTSNGFNINKITKGPITYTTLREFDIFVTGANSSGESIIEPGEIRAIGQFVREGRGLMVIGNQYIGMERDYNYALESLFGISFDEYIEDKEKHAVPDSSEWDWAPIIDLLVEHPITENVYEVVLPRFSSLNLSKNAEPIAFSNPSSTPPCKPMIGVSIFGKGRVIAVGGENLLANDEKTGVQAKDNEKLILNLFNWFPKWITCPNCNLVSPPSTIFCPQCKKPLN